MKFIPSYLVILVLYLCSSPSIFAQSPGKCGAAISTTVGADPVCYGTPLAASPTGAQYRYQWLKDGVSVLGANQPTFPVQGTGKYAVVVRSASTNPATTCIADTSAAVDIKVIEQEAKFSVEKRERIQPQSADTCGIPVKVTLKNESTPETGVTYVWEVTDSGGEAVPATKVKFIDGTTPTSQNPILQFNEKGQYTVKLKITGTCNPNGEDGELDPIDPMNPDADRDGRFVHEEQVIIVYPNAQPQDIEECEDPTPGAVLQVNGSDLIQSTSSVGGPLDYNLGTLRPGSIEWKIVSGTGATIDNPTIENPRFTFPKKGSYVVSLRFANECEFSDVLNGITQITVTFNPLPAKPLLARPEVFVCEGESYTIDPSPSTTNQPKLYNFYTTPTGGRPLNTRGPQPSFSVGPLSGRRVVYVSAFENGCESLERAMLTINTIQQEIKNTITADQTICADTSPAPLIGTNATVGTNRPTYLWESKSVGEVVFTAASTLVGRNDQQNYSPQPLSQTTVFRRSVIFEGCDQPNYSNEVTIEVLPVIDPSENIINVDKPLVCRGVTPTFTGNLISGDIEYVWQSSTTSESTGFVDAPAAQGFDNKNGATFKPAFVTQKTWFRRLARYRGSNCAPVPSNNAILIEIDELPQAPVVKAADVTACQGSSAILEVQPATVPGVTFVWYTELTGGAPIGAGSPFSTPPLTANTTFYVEAINANECVSTRRTTVRVTVLPISASAGRDTTIIEGQTVQLKATGGTKYVWTPAEGLSDPNVANPLARPTKTTTYTVLVSNGTDCEATADVTVTVIPRLIIVNTFSPNRDGINEFWEIENIERYPEATVEIFNRYGAQVFKSMGYAQPWDGTQKGSPLPLATYYYIIRLNKDEKPISGSVTIIR